MIAAVALAFFGFGFSVLSDVTAERSAYVIAFLELALFVATNITFISPCVDQLSI
jgi:hypothetical protein